MAPGPRWSSGASAACDNIKDLQISLHAICGIWPVGTRSEICSAVMSNVWSDDKNGLQGPGRLCSAISRDEFQSRPRRALRRGRVHTDPPDAAHHKFDSVLRLEKSAHRPLDARMLLAGPIWRLLRGGPAARYQWRNAGKTIMWRENGVWKISRWPLLSAIFRGPMRTGLFSPSKIQLGRLCPYPYPHGRPRPGGPGSRPAQRRGSPAAPGH